MKKTKSANGVILIIIYLIFSLNLPNFYYLNVTREKYDIITENNDFLMTSDIAGRDLYAEQINAFIAGNKSLIRQSLFTNDTSILSQFDTTDPAFYNCNIYFSASNAINPEIFPRVLTESDIITKYSISFNGFNGFLYYDKDMNSDDVQFRAKRALEIIKRKFKIDLVMLNVSKSNFFPFVGYYPDWDVFLREITTNLPMDGYWKALDLERLINHNYLENYHISSTFLLINSLDFFEYEFDMLTDQVDFNLKSLDLSFLKNLETKELIEQLKSLIENYSDILNATLPKEELEQAFEIIDSFTLSNQSHYSSLMIQYEGLSDGIKSIGSNQYTFNLYDALGYHENSLAPSEKIYIALAGALMSDIKIDILCTDIIDVSTKIFQFNDFLLERISLIFYLAGIDFNIQTLRDYSFELFWRNEEGIKKSYVKPVNLNDPCDKINLLQQLGFHGLPFIPVGILNPIEEFIVFYQISPSEHNMVITNELIGNTPFLRLIKGFQFNISAENVGNDTVYGIPTPIPYNLDEAFILITLGNQSLATLLKDTIWEIIRNNYSNQYDSLDDFFNLNKDPRIFYFDSLGTGIYDTFYPDFTKISNLWPYNEDMNDIIDIMITDYPQLISSLESIFYTTDKLKSIFTNKESIWNIDNWKLEPRNKISYIFSKRCFLPFYSNNFTIDHKIPELPTVISGISIAGTTPEMALKADNESWIIGSEEKSVNDNEVEVQFVFKNDTMIDFVNNSLEQVSFIINFIDSSYNTNFEIFNFSTGDFQDITPYLTYQINDTWIFSFVGNFSSLKWLFDPSTPINHSIILKLSSTDSNPFNISINDLDIEFFRRDIKPYKNVSSKASFSSASGNVQYSIHSNFIALSKFHTPSIIAFAYLANYSTKEGELNNYSLIFKNIGPDIAEDIRISVEIPGIIQNSNNFTLKNNHLIYYLSKLNPSEEKLISFTFYTPNSRVISNVLINYYNPKSFLDIYAFELYSTPNEVYISAPVDYLKRFPFVRTIKINYDNEESSIIKDVPAIGDVFNLTINLNNTSPAGLDIPNLNISMNDQYGDLKRIDKNTLYFEHIINKISFNITLKKIGWKGYYYPPINFIESSESRTIQISASSFKVLGKINFSLVKSVNKNQIEVGDLITVSIKVENTGTISIYNIKLDDTISYSQSEFSLIDGKLVNFINSLEPGEKLTFNYTIKGKRQAIVNLKPARIRFYYLHEKEVMSNIITIKINTQKFRQLSYIILPILITSVISIVYFWQSKKYRKRRSEIQRFEMHIFELNSRDTILKTEHTLRERLSNLISNPTEKIIGSDPTEPIDKINGKKQIIKPIEIEYEETSKTTLTLHCKSCRSWFVSRKFDIICPICDHDQIYVAYLCEKCKRWYFKEEPGDNYYCKKKTCKGMRLIGKEKEYIQEYIAKEGKVLRVFKSKKKKFNILDN